MSSSISKLLGCDETIYEITETTPISDNNGNVTYVEHSDDVEYARKNIKKVIDTGMTALPDMIRVLRDTDDPKMYTAASNFMETLTKINMEYCGNTISKNDNKKVNTTTNTTNNIVYMTADDAMKKVNDNDI